MVPACLRPWAPGEQQREVRASLPGCDLALRPGNGQKDGSSSEPRLFSPSQDPARSAGFHPSGSVLAVGTVTGR